MTLPILATILVWLAIAVVFLHYRAKSIKEFKTAEQTERRHDLIGG